MVDQLQPLREISERHTKSLFPHQNSFAELPDLNSEKGPCLLAVKVPICESKTLAKKHPQGYLKLYHHFPSAKPAIHSDCASEEWVISDKNFIVKLAKFALE